MRKAALNRMLTFLCTPAPWHPQPENSCLLLWGCQTAPPPSPAQYKALLLAVSCRQVEISQTEHKFAPHLLSAPIPASRPSLFHIQEMFVVGGAGRRKGASHMETNSNGTQQTRAFIPMPLNLELDMRKQRQKANVREELLKGKDQLNTVPVDSRTETESRGKQPYQPFTWSRCPAGERAGLTTVAVSPKSSAPEHPPSLPGWAAYQNLPRLNILGSCEEHPAAPAQ